MDKHHDDLNSVDPKAPHAYKERMNLPYNIPRGGMGPGVPMGPEFAFKRDGVPDDCELCSKRRSDPIHTASDEAADPEHWPL
jgi:hypothetical protein